VNFAFDSAELDDLAKEILVNNAKWLKDHPELKVQIEGHCDERGTEEYNLALGERRAKAVRDYLVSLGISPSRISIISYGESMPLDPGHNESAWAKNRRAHFAIVK
jgi:peptidoglycan-associated lipoprotein